jgi:hypothetical protein
LKIEKLLDISTTMLESVLDFNIQAANGYQGFGNGVLKYPYTFSAYLQLQNTQLVSPMTGTLKAGSSQTFVVSSKDYSGFSIVINDQWNNFVKNNKTGNYELTLSIPEGIDEIIVSGVTKSGNSSRAYGLVQYNVVKE